MFNSSKKPPLIEVIYENIDMTARIDFEIRDSYIS